jgi:hypothetical protein
MALREHLQEHLQEHLREHLRELSQIPFDVYMHIFTIKQIRLRDLINLSMVSRQLRRIALSEIMWHTVSDTKKVLYDFIRQVFKSSSNMSYPIKKMCFTDYCDVFRYDESEYPDLLPIKFYQESHAVMFYKYFPDYQYFYLHGGNGCVSDKIKGLYIVSYFLVRMPSIKCNITEIFAENSIVDCECWPALEKLETYGIQNISSLRKTKLTYLLIHSNELTGLIISNLPVTIESLIIFHGDNISAAMLDQLTQFSRLNFLKIHGPRMGLSTTLNINTIHFMMIWDTDFCTTLNIPNVKNIIISSGYVTYTHTLKKLHLISKNATTCKIYNMQILDLSLELPNCPDVITLHDHVQINYDSNIFGKKS